MVTAENYAHALYAITKEENDANKAVENLIMLLKKKGHSKLLPNILRSFENLVESGRDEDTLNFVCARESDFVKFKDEIQDHFEHADAKYTEEIVDDSIIGGYVIKKGDTVVDASYKKKLLNLYQSATV